MQTTESENPFLFAQALLQGRDSIFTAIFGHFVQHNMGIFLLHRLSFSPIQLQHWIGDPQ